jgi:hypothetical protein
MTVTKRVLSKLQASLPHMCLCKKVLVIAPTERILRGFMFEGTIAKGRYYFWRVVMPLYSPTDFLHLNYSRRIGAKTFHPSSENLEEVTAEVLKVIMDGHFEYLRKVLRPQDLLKHEINHHSLTSEVDAAVTHYLLGDVDKCVSLLEKALAANPYPDYPHAKRASSLLEDLKTNPDSALRRIAGWEKEHIDRLSLHKTMVGVWNS